VYLSHSLIPHDHHAGVVNLSGPDRFPCQQGKHHEAERHPSHCHALNSLVFFKYEQSVNQPAVRETVLFCSSVCNPGEEEPLFVELRRFVCRNIPVGFIAGIDGISLRAPPVVV